ncbi:hypothetical protein [Actinomadura fibrosa]|uniref:DUF732 domain-containing protein n=1 Tax=Actinomadura fibrosa TaxID=111802 RepID=A0ABW2XFF3_9ACTN|nr:hypothetical protein [Actinomadura fibrosa]
MTEPAGTPPDAERRGRWILYTVIAVAVAALMVAGLLAFDAAKENRAAEEKADQLIAALQRAGARTPSRDQIVGVLGDDGGAVCADPGASLTKAVLLSQLANGAGGPGTRPVIADEDVLKGELLILKIYCPDELPTVQKLADRLDLDDVAED